MVIKELKAALKYLRDADIIKSDNRTLLRSHFNNQLNKIKVNKDDIHLDSAINWLKKAHEVTGNGGFAGRYNIKKGWSSSYPETTGYIVPTLLKLANVIKDNSFEKMAQNAIEFLLKLQMNNGAFPGGEISDNPKASFFNSGQILNGITNWYKFSQDEKILEAAIKTGNWMVSIQDDDGAFRKFAYNDLTVTYSSHSSCWLAELGELTQNNKFLNAAEKHMDWVLSKYDDSNGWIDQMGFFEEEHKKRQSVTHTIAYTLWGVLFTAVILDRQDAIEKIKISSKNIANTLNKFNWLPGVLNNKWEGVVDYSCLTGNSQMALVWMKLYEIIGDNYFLDSAVKIIDLVKASQSLNSKEPGINGGIPGSYPIWGGYLYMAFPNWAAKFFIDALLEKQKLTSK